LPLSAGDALEHVTHGSGQRERVEGLDDIAHGPETLSVKPVLVGGPRREEDDRYVARPRVRRELLRDRPTVDSRHHHVEEDERGSLTAHFLQCLRTVLGLEHCETLAFEVDPADRANRRLVVDEEDRRRRLP
jgi:hypothetical protein